MHGYTASEALAPKHASYLCGARLTNRSCSRVLLLYNNVFSVSHVTGVAARDSRTAFSVKVMALSFVNTAKDLASYPTHREAAFSALVTCASELAISGERKPVCT